jgi:hypothetical protein
MFHSFLSRPVVAKLTMAVLFGAQMLGWITLARAEESSPAPAPFPPKSLSAVRRALREFDRFLDHHPLLEDQLRLDPDLIADQAFLAKTPELRDFLSMNPNVGEGLKAYPRYFLNRGLLRQASAPVSFRELAAFKDLFQQQPELQRELTENPELIRDRAYRESHAALRDCLLQHPALARVFITESVSSDPKSHVPNL